MTNAKILIADDDRNICELLRMYLEKDGFSVVIAGNGEEALQKFDEEEPDLLLLDVMMPRMDGYEFTKELRGAGCEIPILMVTAKETSLDKKKGFIAGTDDYIVKPVDEEEMLLRIAALLRRAKIANDHKIIVGSSVLDYDKMTVKAGNAPEISLPQKEFLLIYKFLSYPGKVFTRMALMDEIWDMDSDTDPHTVDVHINRLRDKFKDNPDFEIVTVRGLGYKAVKK